MKNTTVIILLVVLIILVGVGGYFMFMNSSDEVDDRMTNEDEVGDVTNATSTDETDEDGEEDENKTETVIGTSVEGNDITAYHYGSGDENILFVGGLHGGYEWNAVLLNYELMDYLEENEDEIPDNLRVTVIPVLNPDGLEKTVGTTGRFSASDVPSSSAERVAGRFNANNVDLNRNFDCDWQKDGVWQNKTVSGGTSAFSEPETKAFKNLVEDIDLSAVVIWYSAAGGVYASSCHNGVLAETSELTKLYSKASGYKAYEDFNFYEITGDAVNWLAKQKIPAISIVLTNHQDTEFSKNLKGVEAIFDYYAE